MRRLVEGIILAAMLAVVVLGPPAFAHASATSDQLLASAQSTYLKILEAQQAGGNVTSLTNTMNQALALIGEGQSVEGTDPATAAGLYQQAGSLIQEVNQQLPQVESAGRAAEQAELLWLGAFLVSITAVGGLVYFFGSRVFWNVWVRLHRGWVVKKA